MMPDFITFFQITSPAMIVVYFIWREVRNGLRELRECENSAPLFDRCVGNTVTYYEQGKIIHKCEHCGTYKGRDQCENCGAPK